MRFGRFLVMVAMFLLAAVALWVTAESPETGRLWFGLWRTRWIALAGAFALTGMGLGLSLSSRTWLFRCIAIAGSLTLVAGFLELAGRLGVIDVALLFGGQREDPLGTTSAPNLEVSGQTYMDTATAWGLPQSPIPFHYVTNDLGYRNPPGRAGGRVYTLGDSILVSALMPFERTLPALLEERTGAPVVNLALIGIGPQQEVELLRSSELPLDGRLVIHFLFEGNDLLDSQTYRGLEKTERRSFLQMLVIAMQRVTQPVDARARRRTCEINGQMYTFLWTAENYEDSASEHEAIMTEIRAAANETTAAGGRYALVYVPNKLRILGPFCEWPAETDFQDLSSWLSPWRARVQADSKAAGIPLLDVTEPLLSSMREGEVPWFWGDTHLNEAGHEVMATQVAAWIAPWLESELEAR
jgi:lysophospholipase L1-like esterase